MSKETLLALHKIPRALVVVAGGSGSRFGGFKQLAPVAGIPLLVRTLQAFENEAFSEKILVLPESFFNGGDSWEKLISTYSFLKSYQTVAGGGTRAESVLAGVAETDEGSALVAVHDGARPFPPLKAMNDCLELLLADEELAAAIVASPVSDTVKMLSERDNMIQSTIDRERLRRAETPQVARRNVLIEALRAPGGNMASDEAQALEAAGHRVACITHDGYNPKITLRHDIMLAEQYLNKSREVES